MIVPRKILAVKLRALGDTVLMTAPLLELRNAYPDAEIHVVATKTWESVLHNHPGVDRIWYYERHREATSRAKNIAKLALRLRKEKFDVAVNFHASPSSSALCYAIGAKHRSIHFHGHRDKNRYSTVLIPGKGQLKPIIERDMDAVRALGLTIPEGRLPKIFLTDAEKERAKRRLDQLGLRTPVLCIGIGASRKTKMWPIDRFAGIALRWIEQAKGSVLVINGKDEKDLAAEFLRHVDEKSVSWYSDSRRRAEVRSQIQIETEIDLRIMASLFANARAYIGNDSGPKHVAVSSGVPTLTLFGPEDPFEWHPYPRETHPFLYIEGLPCRNDQDPGMKPWCGLHTCIIEEHRCMRQLSEDEAYRTLAKIAPELEG